MRILLICLLTLSFVLQPALATAADAPPPPKPVAGKNAEATTPIKKSGKNGEAKITLNFKDSDIEDVIAGVGQITGKNFIIDPRVKGRVTLISSTPVDVDTVYATFLSVLQVHGYAAIPGESNVVKIVPAVDARQLAGTEVTAQGGEQPPDEVVTQVIPVEHVPAAQLVSILRPLVPQYAHLAAYQPSNMLIISDTAANVARIRHIVRRIESASNDEIQVIPLQYASAAQVVQTLQALTQAAGQNAAGQVTVVADERTNSILIGGDKSERMRLTAIISHLDTPLNQGGSTQVVYLNYADAENLAKILKGYVQDSEKANPGGAAGKGGGGGPQGNDQVSVIPDTDLNALVLTAPPKMMTTLRDVITHLDVRRAQVLVEGIIAEITSDKAAELGVTWAADASDNHGVAGLTNFSGTGAGVAQFAGLAAGGAQAAASIPDGLSFGFGKITNGHFSFAGLLRALAGDGTTNILSTPTLMTLDNEEAQIQVGQEVPFITGSYSQGGIGGGNTNGGSGGIVNPFQTIQRKEVGIMLKITPQINEGNSVVLAIEQEVSSLAANSTGAADLITNKRTIKTHVIADSGQIIVLGGLIDDQLTENEQRVPILGSIPLLGNLFKYRKTKKVKRNLMVFIQPKIIMDGAKATELTQGKYNYMRMLQLGKRKEDVQLMPDESRPLMPTMQEQTDGNDTQPAVNDKSKTAPQTGATQDSDEHSGN